MRETQDPLPDILGTLPKHSKQSLRLWLRLLTCANFIEKRIRARLRTEFDVTLPQFDVLSALERSKKGLTMGQLSEHLMVSNGNVTGVITRLEKEGLIERLPLSGDRRTFVANLTAKGRKHFRKMAKHHERWIDAMFADLSDGEIQDLMDSLDAMKASLKYYDTRSKS